MTKPFYLSKTFWIDLAAVAVISLQAALSYNVVPWAIQADVLAGVNILLRFLTFEGVTIPGLSGSITPPAPPSTNPPPA